MDDSQLILPELKGGAFSATVAIKTGEEQEDAAFSERSKMYITFMLCVRLQAVVSILFLCGQGAGSSAGLADKHTETHEDA